MQISRHWRMNAQRYRLEGVRYDNGEVSLQARPTPPNSEVERQDDNIEQPVAEQAAAR
jgi:hypothetical protein